MLSTEAFSTVLACMPLENLKRYISVVHFLLWWVILVRTQTKSMTADARARWAQQRIIARRQPTSNGWRKMLNYCRVRPKRETQSHAQPSQVSVQKFDDTATGWVEIASGDERNQARKKLMKINPHVWEGRLGVCLVHVLNESWRNGRDVPRRWSFFSVGWMACRNRGLSV